MSVKCGAERSISLETGNGDSGGDVFISAVNGVPIKSADPTEHWIGGSGNVLVIQCRRCVGNPNRECDLNTETWSNLDPQTN